jgi:hypothetical protein
MASKACGLFFLSGLHTIGLLSSFEVPLHLQQARLHSDDLMRFSREFNAQVIESSWGLASLRSLLVRRLKRLGWTIDRRARTLDLSCCL